jgi:hypothetical protein
VRWVVAEHPRGFARPSERAHREALAARERGEDVHVPPFDPDVYLSGGVRRITRVGRYELFQVLGY